MAQGGPPDDMNNRHHRAAMLLATGLFTVKEVAEKLDYSYNRMLTVSGSPLFKVLVEKYRERMADKDMDEAVRIVMDDTKSNVEFLQSIRAGDFEDTKAARVQVQAASILFDRQIARKRHDTVDKEVRVVIERSAAERLTDGASQYEDAIDVTPQEPKTLEQFEHDYVKPDDET